jgi:DNA-binding CsgD family transcriptional regulator
VANVISEGAGAVSSAIRMALRPVSADRTGDTEGSMDFFGALAESADLSMARVDHGLRVVRANDYFHRQFLRSGDVLRGRSLYDFLHPRVHTRLRFQFQHLTEGRRTWFTERVVAVRPGVAEFDGALTGIVGWVRASGSAGITVLLKSGTARQDAGREVARDEQLSELSARVLERVAAGESTPEMAARLQLSRQGVEYHIGSMLRRFDVSNRAALVSKAFTAGMFADEAWPPRVAIEYIK